MKEVIGYLTQASLLPQYKAEVGTFVGDDDTSKLLHLYYPLTAIQDEIEKRSSYLGKFRASEQAAHLLDLVAMTKDESDLFESFSANAAADVFDVIAKHTKDVESAYTVNGTNDTFVIEKEDGTTETVDASGTIHYIIRWYNYQNDNMIEPMDTAVKEALVNRIIFKWLTLAYPAEAQVYLALYEEAVDRIGDRCDRFTKPAIIVSRPF